MSLHEIDYGLEETEEYMDGWIEWRPQVGFLHGMFEVEAQGNVARWSTCHGSSGKATRDWQHLCARIVVVEC